MGKRVNTAKWQEKTKMWKINVQKDGKRRSFYSSTPGKKRQREANTKADMWLDDGLDSSMQFESICEMYIERIKQTTSKANWKGPEHRIKNYIIPCKGKKKCYAITEDDLDEIITNAFLHPLRGNALSKRYLKNIASDLRAIMRFARKKKCSTLEPENIKIPSVAKESTRDSFSFDDILTVFNSDKTIYRGKTIKDRYINAYRLQIVCGFRPGELLGLQNSDISGSKCTINRSINSDNEFTSGKNKNAHRSFILPDIAIKIIEDQKRLKKEEGIISPYLFPNHEGEFTSLKTYELAWKRYRKTNNISPARILYEMRHTFFSVTKNLPPDLIKPIGGHSYKFDGEMYKHRLESDAEIAAIEVNNVFLKVLEK